MRGPARRGYFLLPPARAAPRRPSRGRARRSVLSATNHPSRERLGAFGTRRRPLFVRGRSRLAGLDGGAIASSAEENPSIVSIWVCSRCCCSHRRTSAATATTTRMTRYTTLRLSLFDNKETLVATPAYKADVGPGTIAPRGEGPFRPSPQS